MSGPLDGIRVVDFTWGTAGPVATGLMAAYGAEVLRVEPPGGDPFRELIPAYPATRRATRSLELDLKSTAGRGRALELLDDADVLMESWRPGVARRLGMDFATIHSRNPALVYCSISSYGEDGPDADLPGYDSLVEARVGMMAAQGGAREPPIYLGVHVGGLGAGLLALAGTLAALCGRNSDGAGRRVDTSMFDGALAYMTMYWSQGQVPIPAMGGGKPGDQWTAEEHRRRLIVANFECADGEYLGVHTGATGAHARFIEAVGLSDRVPPAAGPLEKREPLSDDVAALVASELPGVMRSRKRADWIARLLDADVCVIPVLRPGEAYDEAQVLHNELIVAATDTDQGELQQVGPPFRFARSSTLQVGAARPAADWVGHRAKPPVGKAEPVTSAPLAGIRVIDFGAFVAGPFASRVLGDLGADVIRIEGLNGDNMRPTVPPFHSANRNKRSIAVDFKTAAGREVGQRLLAWADIAQHNMRPGAAERLGLDYESARAVNPEIVYLYSPGWGVDGPDSHRMGFAPLFSGAAGLQYLAGGAGNPPGAPIGNEDTTNGLLGACAALMALYRRGAAGHGDFVASPQINATLFMALGIMRRDGQVVPTPMLDGEQLGLTALDRLYRCADDYLCVWGERDQEFERLASALGLGRLATDPRFATVARRRANDSPLARELARAFATDTAANWHARLAVAGIPCEMPAGESRDRFLKDPAHLATGRVAQHPHPELNTVWDVGTLVRIDGEPRAADRRAPLLGEHTDEILAMLGYSPSEISELHSGRVVRSA